jgi:cyanophycinase
MMSEIMVVEGKDDEAPRKCTLKMAPGMGLLAGVIIDQHFNQRGRIGRLLAAVAQNPNVIGIGVDEDTAMIVNEKLEFVVEGSGVVTVVDGREISYTNISEQYPDDPLAITNVKIHVFPRGYGFNLVKKQEILIKDTFS